MKKPTGISRVAPGTSGEVVDFAQRQVYSPGELISPVPTGAPRRNLQRVLCDLLASEINAGLQTFAFDIVRVWIGDELNGFDAVAEVKPEHPAWSDDAAIAPLAARDRDPALSRERLRPRQPSLTAEPKGVSTSFHLVPARTMTHLERRAQGAAPSPATQLRPAGCTQSAGPESDKAKNDWPHCEGLNTSHLSSALALHRPF